MAVFTRRIRMPKKHRAAVAQIINEITAPPQKRMKTDIYNRGMVDGIELVRKRAMDRGIPLDRVPEPLVVVTEILVDFEATLQSREQDKLEADVEEEK